MKKMITVLTVLMLCLAGLQGCVFGSNGQQGIPKANVMYQVDVKKEKNTMNENENEKQAIRKFYDETWEAMVAKDMPKLDEQHADKFVLVHMTGMRQPKQEFLKSIRNGDLNYFKSVPENVMITISGNKAKIIGQNRVTASVFGGSTNVWRLQLAFDAEKDNGKWRMTYCKASTY